MEMKRLRVLYHVPRSHSRMSAKFERAENDSNRSNIFIFKLTNYLKVSQLYNCTKYCRNNTKSISSEPLELKGHNQRACIFQIKLKSFVSIFFYFKKGLL